MADRQGSFRSGHTLAVMEHGAGGKAAVADQYFRKRPAASRLIRRKADPHAAVARIPE